VSRLALYKYLPACLLAISWGGSVLGQSSVLQSGEWLKFSVEENGVYKITYDALRKAGINPATADPKTIRIFGNAGGMLPQANSAAHPNDLTELAIQVVGEDDGAFNSSDYILFYAEGPDDYYFDPQRNTFAYEHNLYATRNFFFLTFGEDPGLRITQRPTDDVSAHPLISHFNDFIYHERDEYNLLKSGREWFGERFDANPTLRLSWDVRGIRPNSNITVVSDVMGQSSVGSSFSLYVNNVLAGEQYLLPVPGATYAVKGEVRRDTFTIDASPVISANPSSLEARYEYSKSGAGTGYLNFLLLSFERDLALYGDQTPFRSGASLAQAYSTFVIASANSLAGIWDVTDPYAPINQAYSVSGNNASFATATSTLREFIAFSDKIPEPAFEGVVPNQDLHGMTTPELLIVTHEDFMPAAEQLAAHRSAHSGWSSAVVTTTEIFNEFSSGRQDVTAIRDFAKYLYDKSPGTLKALLLFGKCSYDYKDRIERNTNFVPTYESRNSLHPLNTYSSDDYFGFLEDNEGMWEEDAGGGTHTMDIGVGRLPVTSLDEAQGVVTKIIEYETSQSHFGQWRSRIAFVADDGDANIHQDQADQMAEDISSKHPEVDTHKIYLDAFRQVQLPAGESSPETERQIIDILERGALIINYTGHGNEKLWAHERIFDDFVIARLQNKTYPLFVTATCEFGRHDDPSQQSSAELCVLRSGSGAIAMVSTARPVESNNNFALNKAFYSALFELQTQGSITLGELFRRTKNASESGVSNRNFSLLGDPSLQLAFPRYRVRVTSIEAGNTTDTLRALSHVTIRGEIVGNDSARLSSFNGIVEARVYDKRSEFTTLGDENLPYTYQQWANLLHQGSARVTDGTFAFSFVVTRNIAYTLGNGKLSLYAYDAQNGWDAAGSESDFVVGESEKDPAPDNVPPTIALYIGDTTFRNGGIASPDTRLLVRLADSSGINLSAYGIGNSLVAVLDDSVIYNLEEYYQSDIDDFTKGWVKFPLRRLSPGRHTITVMAWDTYNNPAYASIDFIVSDGDAIVIERFVNYPNPFSTSTTLSFTHNRSGDHLFAALAIYDLTGRLLITKELSIPDSPYEVKLLELDTNEGIWKNVQGGLYVARLVVRSVTNGTKNERVTKLIVAN
jgi:hypothetical protein